jgi:hypothetical protein
MPSPGQPTLYKPEYCELAHNYCLLGTTNEVQAGFFGVTRRTVDDMAARLDAAGESMRRRLRSLIGVSLAETTESRRRHGGPARCRRGEHAPCRRVRSLIGVSLAEIAEIGLRRFRRSGHGVSMRAIFTDSTHLARSSRSCAARGRGTRLWPPVEAPSAFRVAGAMRHS